MNNMKKLKRIGVLLLAAILLIQSGAVLVSAEEAQKELVYSDQEVKEIVAELRDFGLFDLWVTTETFFTEDAGVTRAEAAEALVKLLGYDNMSGSNNGMFYDVPDYHERAGVISVISSMGVMTGAGDGLFVPEGEILKSEFAKAIVYALGYGWKATVEGGYPTGYMTVAKRMGLLDGVEGDISAPLTRAELVKILKNSLNVPVYRVIAVNGDFVEFSIDKEETLLTYFHKIYTDKGIVNSSVNSSLVGGFKPTAEKVLIGEKEIYVGKETEIYDYFGYEVEYRYYHNTETDRYELLKFVPTAKNKIVELSWRDINPTSNAGEIFAFDEDSEIVSYEISPSATYIYNKEQINRDIDEKIKSFNGKLRMVDRNNDSKFDIVFIEDHVYDKVTSNSISRNKMLYCENSVYDFSDTISLTATTGYTSTIEPTAIAAGDIVEITMSESGEIASVNVLTNISSISGVTRREDSISTSDGLKYYYGKELSADHKNDIKNSPSVSIVFNSENEIVWVSVGARSNILGYLIKVGDDGTAFGSRIRFKILNTAGLVVALECADKITIDGKLYKEEDGKIAKALAEIKTGLSLASDGVVSQLITYGTNDDGEIKEIGTAADPDGLTMNINYNDYAAVNGIEYIDIGWGTGSFELKYASSTSVPMFRVPISGQDTLTDNYFSVTKPSFGSRKYRIDHYSSDPSKIDPCAFVLYETETNSATAKAKITNGLILVEELYQALDADGMTADVLAGWTGSARKEWKVDMEVIPEVDEGDLCIFATNSLGEIVDLEKVYDYGTETVLTPEFTDEQGKIHRILTLHVYDAPSGSNYIKTYKKGFADGVPADEHLQLFTFVYYDGQGKYLFNFDRETKTFGQGKPPMLVSGKQDPVNYSKIVMRIEENRYLYDAVIYY